jgi:aspartate aminotransferase
MSTLSNRINNLSESATIKMAKLGRELAAKGVDVISLSLGETDFFTPDFVKDAAKKAIDANQSYYTPVAGIPDLRKAIAAKLKRENNLDFNFDQIVVSTGAKQSLANAIMCLVNPGEEVIIPTPYWVSYSELVKLAEGESVFINATIDTDFKISPEELEAAITPKSKLFMFSSPNNPTGTVYTREELAALVKVFEKYPNIYIISDEIYEHINFIGEHVSIAEFESVKDRVIIINGLSKAYAMTGWRLGFSASNKAIADACDKLQSQVTSGTCSITQHAGAAAYQGSLDGLKVNVPAGAFYFFPDVRSFFGKTAPDGSIIANGDDLALYLLNTGHVATVSGDSFGDPNGLRISYAAADDKLIEAMSRIKYALEQLKDAKAVSAV